MGFYDVFSLFMHLATLLECSFVVIINKVPRKKDNDNDYDASLLWQLLQETS